MNASTKTLARAEGSARFLRQTVVSSMEGVLFALLSSLLALAVATAVLEDFGSTSAFAEATAAAPAVRLAETTVVGRAAARAR
jgi:hypothetical protein